MKNCQQFLINALLVATVGISLVGCGTKNTENEASINIQFSNQTASVLKQELNAIGPRGFLPGIALQSNALLGETPLIYQMKFVTIYLVQDIDPITSDNVGDATRIWTSRKCDADLTLCGISPITSGEYVVDYFNFAAGSAAVNQAFKNYKRDTKESTLNPGTYNYLRADFTGKVVEGVNDTVPNMMFGTMEAHEVRAQNQALLVRLPEPLILEKGESFTVDLAYDLENSFYESGSAHARPAEVEQASKWTCDGEGEAVPCIIEAEFHPTVTKNK